MMEEKRKQEANRMGSFTEWAWRNRIYLWSIAIPSLIMLIVWIANGVGPFGDTSLIIVDGLHQYMPFYSNYHEILRTGGNLFYSLQEGLGSNFLSLWAYYLASPMNLLIVLFPKAELNTAVSLIVTIKIVLSAFTFAYYLLHKQGHRYRDIRVIPFAFAYAMSNYVIGFYWNVMWMDCIFIFPLIMLGFEYLVHKKDARLYVITLFYSLWCNYYMSFMVCLFLVIWFLFYDYKTFKEFIVSGIRFAIGSLLAAGMAAIVLLPAYKGIMETASATRVLPGMTQYTSYIDILQAQFICIEPINSQTFDGGVNLYCGIFALLLAAIYLCNRKIELYKKLRLLVLLCILVISFNTELLNYIWHGFHNQYGIPNRFSFLYIWVLLVFGYETLQSIGKIYKLDVIAAFILTGGFCVLAYFKASSTLGTESYVGTLLLLLLYTVFILLYRYKIYKRRQFRIIITIAMTLEIIAGASYGWYSNNVVNVPRYFSDTETIDTLRNELQEEDSDLYRMDIVNSKMLDEATWHNLPSVGIFGSTAQGNMVHLMGRLGFYTGANEYLYCGATPLTNAMLGVKYVFLREGDFNNADMLYKTGLNGVSVYENSQYLPIAYVVNQEIKDWDYEGNVFVTQNRYVTQATGITTQMFSEFLVELEASGTNCMAEAQNAGYIQYTRTESAACSVKVSFEVPRDMDLYANCTGGNIKNIRFLLDDQEITCDRYQLQCFHLGHLSAGQKVTLEYELNDSTEEAGSLRLLLAEFNTGVFEQAYHALQDEAMVVTSHKPGQIEGTVENKQAGILFTSIPYDTGWSVLVDGKQVEPIAIGNALMGIELEAGKHTISMKYTSPGFVEGAKITGIAVIGVLLWFVGIYIRQRGKKKEKVSNGEEEN